MFFVSEGVLIKSSQIIQHSWFVPVEASACQILLIF